MKARLFGPSMMLLATAAATSAAGAQSTEARLAVGGGTATDARGTTSSAATVAPSLVFSAPGSSFVLGGSATSFGGAGWAAGASTALAGRSTPHDRLHLTLDLGGGATRTSFGATFATGEVVPAAELRLRALTLFGGARAAVGHTRQRQSAAPAPVGGSFSRTVAATRTSIGPVFGGSLRLGAGLRLGYREERAAVDGTAQGALPSGFRAADRVGSVTIVDGPVTLSGSAGQRRAPNERATFAAGALTVALGQSAAIEVGGGTYPSSLLTGTPGGRYLSAGIVLRRGGPRRTELPAPSGAPRPAAGTTRLSFEATRARRVEVAGDWNGWAPVAMTRAPNGVWYADLALDPGRYRYAFRVDGATWDVPDGAGAVDDGFGGRSAWLTVRERTP